MNIINKTELTINFINDDEVVVEIKPSENACFVKYYKTGEVFQVMNLPDIKPNTLYIVTIEVLKALNELSKNYTQYERSDIVAIKNNNGGLIFNDKFNGVITTNYFEQMKKYVDAI